MLFIVLIKPLRKSLSVKVFYLVQKKFGAFEFQARPSGVIILFVIKTLLIGFSARRVEKFKASQAALEIRNEDHAGHGKVEIIGKTGIAE